jgi:hypothetical protein
MLIALLFLFAVGMVLLVVAVLATRRQLRLGRQALAPVTGLVPAGPPFPAERAPIISVPSLAGETLTIGGISRDPRFLLLIFIEAYSSLCETIVKEAGELCARLDVRLLLLGDGQSEDYADLLVRHRVPSSAFILNAALGEEFLIGALPSAALINPQGEMVARGTVQRREQLETLLLSVNGAPQLQGRIPA